MNMVVAGIVTKRVFTLLRLGILGCGLFASGCRETPKPPPPEPVPIPEPIPTPEPPPQLPRLWACGTQFCKEGTADVWHWQGWSAFSLLFDLATGQEAKVDAFLDKAKEEGATILRVFTTAVHLFDLDPGSGRAQLGRLARKAAERGLYLEVVGLADTAQRGFDHSEHLAAIGAIAADRPNILIEVANEPNHPTQVAQVKDHHYLMALRQLVPPYTLTALGASHGTDDENPIYCGGDYVTVHGDRKGGWDSVRHTREQQYLRDHASGCHKPVVNDEPDKYLTLDQHTAIAALTRLYGLGDTLHLDSLRYSERPSMGEADARRRGWQVLGDWRGGRYCNHSSTNCDGAIESWNTNEIVRLYGALDGSGRAGYTVGLGVRSDASIRWNWHHELLLSEGQVRVWRMQR